jgi:hypothetical protein
MTTTSHLQQKPDYYSSIQECVDSKNIQINTNPRYIQFKQTHFTAGDEEQFQKYRDTTNGQVSIKRINLNTNIFKGVDLKEDIEWSKYKNLNAMAVNNTFRYIFNKFKKGIFVKIQNNQLRVFLPFSKNGFVNEWSKYIQIDPKFGNMYSFMTYINKMYGKNYKVNINRFTDNWYANNCLIRSEYPIYEGDTNVPNMSDMFKELCANRKIPDMEFFINRRDFPIITKNSTEAYDHLFGDDHPLISHKYDKYAPILSMVTTNEYADIPIPTGDDWARVSACENKFFGKDCRIYPNFKEFNIKWEDKKPTAVFRGTSTGCGVTIDTNMRLKLAYLSVITPPDKDGPLLDAGISKWQLRPRKIKGEKYLQTINVPDITKKGVKLVSFLSPFEQSKYKYIIHIDGNVSAFRLSSEMSMGCCILLVNSKYRLWFRKMLVPMVHYVPVKADLSDLIEKIKWCKSNDKECEKIAKNAKNFYLKYLQKDGIFDYLQKLLIELKKKNGIYLYNTESPLKRQIRLETNLNTFYPKTNKTVNDICSIPKQSRSFGVLKGMEWIVNMVNDTSVFTDVAKKRDNIFTNKSNTVIIEKYSLANFLFSVKATTDKTKIQENIHETFIGTKVINQLIKYIPNFSYVFGKTNDMVITEYIFGKTFDEWIKSDQFNMEDYIFILIQLAFSLQVAQNIIGFVHYDLTPWNIIIQELPCAITFDYMLDRNNIFRVKTKFIPVIIDYGKSHVIYEKQHYGYINMYRMSTIQDIISLLLTSLNSVLKLNLSDKNVDDAIKLANFISNSKYRQKPFQKTGPKGVSDIQYFISRNKKYSEIISNNKYELENLTPYDFVKYINKHFKYTFTYKKINFPNFRINKGDPTQVFEYVLSTSEEEKIQSFVNVFNRPIIYPKQINLFYAYYSAQTLENNITSVYNLMLRFLGDKNKEPYIELYNKSIKKIKKIYQKQFKQYDENLVKYSTINISEHSSYNNESFLLPDNILNLLEQQKDIDQEDFSEFKSVLEQILINQGIFKLSDKHQNYCIKTFKKLLETEYTTLKSSIANVFTLLEVSKCLYKNDKQKLLSKLSLNKSKNNCDSINHYINIYNQIECFFQKNHLGER